MEQEHFPPNKGKALTVQTESGTFARYPIRTHVIRRGESIPALVRQYVSGRTKTGDLLFFSEKIIAVCQGRAFDIGEIRPSATARFLCRFVYKSPHGIGLGSPWTMELALRDVGPGRILFAAACAALTKPFGIRGVFYRIAGTKARAIDGPCAFTIPPYDHFAVLAPEQPDRVAEEIAALTGCGVVIIDANDLGVDVLGRSSKEIPVSFCKQVFRDNPLGQSRESTPICIVRKLGPAR